MSKGPPPKPLEIKILQGNPGKESLPEPLKIAPNRNPLPAPGDMHPAGVELWNWAVQILWDLGIADNIDVPALTSMCRAWGYAEELREALAVERANDDSFGRRLAQVEKWAEIARAAVNKDISENYKETGELLLSARKVTELAKLETQLLAMRSYQRVNKLTPVALTSSGELKVHPLVQAEIEAQKMLLRFYAEYGLTASARARLGLAIMQGKSMRDQLEDTIGKGARG